MKLEDLKAYFKYIQETNKMVIEEWLAENTDKTEQDALEEGLTQNIFLYHKLPNSTFDYQEVDADSVLLPIGECVLIKDTEVSGQLRLFVLDNIFYCSTDNDISVQ